MFLQNFAAIEDGFMLGHAGNQMVAFIPIRLSHSFDGEVIGFGGTAGKNYLSGGRADQFGHLIARRIDRRLGFPAKRMAFARGIAKARGEIGQHNVQHARIHLRSGVIIEVNGRINLHK